MEGADHGALAKSSPSLASKKQRIRWRLPVFTRRAVEGCAAGVAWMAGLAGEP